jgi:hypothetical protein
MQVSGNLDKMITSLANVEGQATVVHYWLPLGEEKIFMNDHIGKHIILQFENQINCVVCGRKTRKAFGQGFCYPCFMTSPENAECIIRPELCRGHLGEGRDPDWESKHHVQPHYVYLASSSDIKVGVTRDSQIPTRWIDQGADRAVIIAKTPNRYEAGIIEMALKQFMPDKTDWRKMLKGERTDKSLEETRKNIFAYLPENSKAYFMADSGLTDITFPVSGYPQKVTSLGFDKNNRIEGVLKGIKGQYLILNDDTVINIRAHSGYKITFETTAG